MEGWIKIHHKFLDWEWFQEDGMVRLFINILLRANYRSKRYKGFEIGRGQLVSGRKQLSQETGLSEQNIRTCLKRLEQTGEISLSSTNKFTVITISNYDSYQIEELKICQPKINQQNVNVNDSISTDYEDGEKDSNQQSTNNQPTTNQQLTNKKEKINQQNVNVNDSISTDYEDGEKDSNQQSTNKKNEIGEKSTTTKEIRNIYKETTTNVVVKKDKLSLANEQKLMDERSKKFGESLIPYIEIYGKEMIRAFYNYWSEPNRSKTKMRCELERTWDLKLRLNTWSNRDKNISNGTKLKQQQQQQRANEIAELNRRLMQSDE